MESMNDGSMGLLGLFGSVGALFFILVNIVSVILLVKFWIMTNDVREMKTLLKELLDQKKDTGSSSKTKKENPVQKSDPVDPGWASDVTEAEMAQAKSLLSKLYANEVIVKDLSTNQVAVWDKESWNQDKTDKHKLLYSK